MSFKIAETENYIQNKTDLFHELSTTRSRLEECINTKIKLLHTNPKHNYECSQQNEESNVWVTSFPVPLDGKTVYLAYQIVEERGLIDEIHLLGIKSYPMRK